MYSKFSYLASLVLLLSFRSYAQNLSDLPTCAQSPALSAIGSTGCQASDFKCLCKDNSFINAALAGAEKQCPQSDMQKVLSFAQQLCGSVGVSLSPSATAPSSAPLTITNTHTPTSAPSSSSRPSQSAASTSSSSRSATATSQTSGAAGGGSTTSGANGWNGEGFGLRGMLASGAVVVVVGWCGFGVWA